MIKPSLTHRRYPRRLLAAGCLAAALFLTFPPPVRAAGPTDPVFASWFSRYFSGMATRSRVVQVCVVTMCAALFIMMKKFDAAEPRR